jgi:hypothetical protein
LEDLLEAGRALMRRKSNMTHRIKRRKGVDDVFVLVERQRERHALCAQRLIAYRRAVAKYQSNPI